MEHILNYFFHHTFKCRLAVYNEELDITNGIVTEVTHPCFRRNDGSASSSMSLDSSFQIDIERAGKAGLVSDISKKSFIFDPNNIKWEKFDHNYHTFVFISEKIGGIKYYFKDQTEEKENGLYIIITINPKTIEILLLENLENVISLNSYKKFPQRNDDGKWFFPHEGSLTKGAI